MSVSQEPNPALVFDLVNSFHKTEALKAAVELDLFAALGEGNSTVKEIARRCKSTQRGIRILCDYLSILGVVVKQEDQYFHSPTSGAFLDPQSPACIASIVKVLNNPIMMDSYDHLSKVIRQGYTNLPGQGTVEPEHPIWVEFAHNMAPMMAPMTAPLGNAVLNGNRGPMRVLDVAAGHGLFGIEVARQNPQAEIVAVDWKPVLEVARANAEKAGVGHFLKQYQGIGRVDFELPNKAFHAALDEVVTQKHEERGFAQKGLRCLDSMCQSQRFILRYISYAALPAGAVADGFPDIGARFRRDDYTYIFCACFYDLFEHIEQYGLIRYRQELFGYGVSDGLEPCAFATCQYQCLHQHSPGKTERSNVVRVYIT